jgi:hypothetical protein
VAFYPSLSAQLAIRPNGGTLRYNATALIVHFWIANRLKLLAEDPV